MVRLLPKRLAHQVELAVALLLALTVLLSGAYALHEQRAAARAGITSHFVDHDPEALQALQRRTLVATAIAAVLAGLGGAAMLRLLLRKPLRAIERAGEFAVGLQHGDGRQLAAVDGPAEIRDLGLRLNLASSRLLAMRLDVEAAFAELRRSQSTLRDANDQLRTVFALSPDALVCFDKRDRVGFANDAFFGLTGLQPADVMDQPAARLDRLLRQCCAGDGSYAGLEAYFPRPGQPASRPAATRLTLARPRYTVLELIGVPGEASSVGRLLYLRDITQQSEVDRMKTEFLSTAAHELRTPMTGIHACVELMQAREFDAPRRQHMLGMMKRQSLALITVVDELLDLARIEARHDADFEYGVYDLAAVVGQATSDFAAPEGRSAPEITAGRLTAYVRVDRQKAAQVVRNLLSNAYKYSRDGAVCIRLLDPRQPAEGPRVGFEVQDHGIGMSPEQLARIGERFYRADASGHIPGTGLGISIVTEIVELMGGRLTFASEAGKGTTVTVWLPHAVAVSVPALARAEPRRLPQAATVDSTLPTAETATPG